MLLRKNCVLHEVSGLLDAFFGWHLSHPVMHIRHFPGGIVNRDLHVLALPKSGRNKSIGHVSERRMTQQGQLIVHVFSVNLTKEQQNNETTKQNHTGQPTPILYFFTCKAKKGDKVIHSAPMCRRCPHQNEFISLLEGLLEWQEPPVELRSLCPNPLSQVDGVNRPFKNIRKSCKLPQPTPRAI